MYYNINYYNVYTTYCTYNSHNEEQQRKRNIPFMKDMIT